MTAIQAESSKQMAAVKTEIAKLAETLKAQFRQENEKHAASLTDRFEAANAKLREELNVKLQHQIQGVSERVNTLIVLRRIWLVLGFRLEKGIFSGCHHSPYTQIPGPPYAMAPMFQTQQLQIVDLKVFFSGCHHAPYAMASRLQTPPQW